jgi:hypothetical protein
MATRNLLQSCRPFVLTAELELGLLGLNGRNSVWKKEVLLLHAVAVVI